MATPDLILLRLPWGLIGHSRTRRNIFSPEPVSDSGRVATLVFSRDEQPLLVNGDERKGELFVDIRTRLDEKQRVWDIPIPLHDSEAQALRFHTWVGEASIEREHRVSRPMNTFLDDEKDSAQEGVGSLIVHFLQAIAARMQDFETALTTGRDPWDHVLVLWLDPEVPRDPTMDILVRHAREHRATWADIAERPRRLLNRSRELVALSRVQEVDVQCMRWLSRQPGDTLAERAGGRQRILALARHENRNTLENRVFLDLMVRSVAAARDYLAMNEGRSVTSRTQSIKRYKQECRNLNMELTLQGVSRQIEPVQPNYVLLYDERYRHVWTTRQEIMKRERATDDLWRWQHRSWAEFCKSVVAASLLWISGAERCFAAPMFVANEHRRGHWLIHDDPMIVVAHWQKGWVVELLSGNSDDVPKKKRELCASLWLRYADFNGGDYTYIAVWTVHRLDGASNLRELVDSANQALEMLRDRSQLGGGIVLASHIDPSAEAGTEEAELVSGCVFGPYDNQLTDALERLGECIQHRIEASLCDH